MERIAANNGPAVRMLVSPVGQSCATARIGSDEGGAIQVDARMRLVIDFTEPREIGAEATYEILLTELDLKNRSCKFRLREDDDQDQRYNGDITDPEIMRPHNPYSAAMDGQQWILVRGKPEIRDGEIERLYISNVLLSASARA